MSKFQLGILIGCFFGALIMFVALGIIHLFLQAQHENRARTREHTAPEILNAMKALSHGNAKPLEHLPQQSSHEAGEEEVTICYLSIRIE